MAFNEPLEEVLACYPYQIRSTRLESYKGKKAVWWVDTDAGTMILKKHPNSEATVKFLLGAISHLQENHINIPKICKTVDDQPYVLIGKKCYVLMEAVNGRNPTYHSDDLELYIRELGKFHKASRGYTPPEDSKLRDHLGKWPASYRMQASTIQKLYEKEAAKDTHNTFGDIFIREYPYFDERMKKNLAMLDGPFYAAWVEKLEQIGGLCHQDFAAGNILIDPMGRVYVLDTDSLTFDLPARDIRKVLNKMMKKDGHWDESRLEKVIQWYQEENPLTQDEWQVVKMDLMYPHLFFGVILKYYRKKEPEWNEQKHVNKLVEMVNVEKSFDQISDIYDKIVNRVVKE